MEVSLLREAERLTGIIRQSAACFTDHRNPDRIEHTVEELIAQRIYALALGYEDLNDHDDLRHDPLLAVLVGKPDHLRVTVRKVWVSFTESCPYQSLFRQVCDHLCRQPPFPLRC